MTTGSKCVQSVMYMYDTIYYLSSCSVCRVLFMAYVLVLALYVCCLNVAGIFACFILPYTANSISMGNTVCFCNLYCTTWCIWYCVEKSRSLPVDTNSIVGIK